jgi:hypothetical protein
MPVLDALVEERVVDRADIRVEEDQAIAGVAEMARSVARRVLAQNAGDRTARIAGIA